MPTGGDWPVSLEAEPTPTRSIFRTVVGPLVAYHVLILVGAYLIVLGYVENVRVFEVAGIGFVVVGVLTELWVLRWSAGITRRAARPGTGDPIGKSESTGAATAQQSVCLRCGARDPTGVRRTCRRCGNPMVRL
jgi:ribosomal protein L40E